jgi:hypothetical protein
MRQDLFDIETEIKQVASRAPLGQDTPAFKQIPDAWEIDPGDFACVGGHVHDAEFGFCDET